MGFLSRRLKRNRQGRLRSGEYSSQGDNPLGHLLRAFGFLAIYIVWSSMTFPRSSGWRADIRIAIEKQLGWKSSVKAASNPASLFQDMENLFGNNDNGLENTEAITTGRYHRHRIPCGLIVIDKEPASSTSASEEEVDVLPLTTFAIVPADDGTTLSSDDVCTTSMLRASALSKYPMLKRFIVEVETSSDRTRAGKEFKRMIPEGTFRLRMGSEESTIEKSPKLWIIEDEPVNENSNIGEDLVLGTAFWESHGAGFGSDEVYLYPRPALSEGGIDETNESRVMVPFLRTRSRPSFATDDL